MKAAATDALKKCAAEIGIAADIYNSEDFREVNVDVNEITIDTLRDLYLEKKEKLSQEDDNNICRIIKFEETKSYSKAFKTLNEL